MNPLVAALAGSGLVDLAASQTRSQTESQADFKTTRLRLRFGLGASPRHRLRRCHWGLQAFRSTADKPAQECIDSAAQRRPQASACIAVATEPCNVQRSHRFGSFATCDAKHALLIRPSAARSLSNIQAHTLGS